MIKKVWILAVSCFITLMAMTALTATAAAADRTLHQDTETYRVYLGVVPVNLLKKKPVLIDGAKSLHGGITDQASFAQHVMVAVFTKEGNERVLDATVIGRVSGKQLFGGEEVAKPMEKMLTGGTVTYGNFFDMPKNQEYEIEVEIYESDRTGSESATFVFEKP